MPVIGDLLAGRYRIVAPLGAGGMATVHRARDERLDRDVAIKILLPNHAGDPVLAARFEREARSLAAFAHPGVVAVYDVDPGDPATGREPFFVMELCSGGSLADRISDGRRLPPDELIPILISVADGLAGLHARGVVHRDVKPPNILLAPDRAKLADFGLARTADVAELSDLTAPGTAVGTLAYLAPEILAGGHAGPAGDVYALGVAAFAGLTGRLPRPASSLADLVAAGARPAPRVSQVAPELGTAFDEPVAAALDADPGRRPDAVVLETALTSALGRWSRGRADVAPGATHRPTNLEATTAVVAVPTAADGAAWAASATASSPPVPPSPVRVPGRPPARRPAREANGRALPLLGLPLLAAAVAALLIAGLLVAIDQFGPVAAAPSGGAPSPSPSPFASPSSSPSPSPSPSATPVATPTVVQLALAALDEVDAAIAAASGGGGLKGKERNEIEGDARAIRSALAAGNLDRARDLAGELAERVDKAADELSDAQAARLIDAVDALVAVLRGG